MALQTKTFTKQGDKGYSLKLVLTEISTNVAANTSLVSYAFYLVRTNYGFYASQPFSWNISIGGQTIAISGFTFNIPTSGPQEQLIKSGQVSVSHNGDGTKTMSFDVSTPDASWISPTYGPTEMRMTGTWALTTIPRASSISAINADIGGNTLITISRASSNFLHTVTYKFGSLSGTVATKTNQTSIPWTIPESFFEQIPNAKYGNVTLTCKTYSGSTLLGEKTTTFRAIAYEDECRPTVTGSVVATDTKTAQLTGSTGKLIRYISTARATISASAKNSAKITKKTVNGVVLESTKDFQAVETDTFTFVAQDSRGYTGSKTAEPETVQYIPLTLTPSVKRITSTGDTVSIALKGNFWDGNFGAVDNALTISYQYQQEGGSWSAAIPITDAVISGNSYTAAAEISGIDYREGYVFRLTAGDSAMELTRDVSISAGVPVFDWGKDDFALHVLLKAVEAIFSGTVTLSKTTDASGTADNGPALIVGGTRTKSHLEMDANEIMAKSNGTTPSALYLNNDGGVVVVGSGGLQPANLTASRAVVTDGSKKLISSAVTATELGYLDGVTSNIQTQLNSKLSDSSSFCKLIYRGTISQNESKTATCAFTPWLCTYFMSSANSAAPWVTGAINFGKLDQEFYIYIGGTYQRFKINLVGKDVTITKTGSDTVYLVMYAHR